MEMKKKTKQKCDGLTIASPARSGKVAGGSFATILFNRLLLLYGILHHRIIVGSFTTLFQFVQILLLRSGQHLSQKSSIFPIC